MSTALGLFCLVTSAPLIGYTGVMIERSRQMEKKHGTDYEGQMLRRLCIIACCGMQFFGAAFILCG